MSENESDECCPRFNPDPWDDKTFTWENKRFVKDRVTSFLHVPLNFGSVMKRNVSQIEAANARPENLVVLADENSLWGADVYIEVTKDVPGAKMAAISGTFLSKVFEGPYRNVRNWIGEMKTLVEGQGKNLQNCIATTQPAQSAQKCMVRITLSFWRKCKLEPRKHHPDCVAVRLRDRFFVASG
ncbi:hydrolase [Bythopirellula polymerisocia]|uniref:Uncharacterized protein n=1 Tax=Bythopirellula polymerisocia TaxID=2528003 RepID=A0A5C6CG40_9BACT|nr:hydrolase [Bythopirellula polymerisocia]TWU22677.1 hypothetical protein Pla144_41370 [Bythopirellula polymerisocia]